MLFFVLLKKIEEFQFLLLHYSFKITPKHQTLKTFQWSSSENNYIAWYCVYQNILGTFNHTTAFSCRNYFVSIFVLYLVASDVIAGNLDASRHKQTKTLLNLTQPIFFL